MLHKSERLNTHLHIIEFGWHSWVPPSPLLKCTHYSPFLFCCQCMVQFIVIFGVEQYKDVNVIQYLIMGLAASVKNSVFYSIHLFKKFCPIVVVVVVFFFNCVWFWYRGKLSLWKGFIVAGTGLENYLNRKNCQVHLNQTLQVGVSNRTSKASWVLGHCFLAWGKASSEIALLASYYLFHLVFHYNLSSNCFYSIFKLY